MMISWSEGAAIPLGNKGREDRFRLPMRQKDTKWTLEPIYADEDDETMIALSMDKATAGANAVALVWPETNVKKLHCNMHAGARFVHNNRLDFNNFKDNKTIIQNDMHHHLKNLAHVNFVATAKLKMVQKWESVLKEPTVARKWYDSWRNDSLTRVESNREEISPLRGGVPADNNAIESGNNADKQAMESAPGSTVSRARPRARLLIIFLLSASCALAMSPTASLALMLQTRNHTLANNFSFESRLRSQDSWFNGDSIRNDETLRNS